MRCQAKSTFTAIAADHSSQLVVAVVWIASATHKQFYGGATTVTTSRQYQLSRRFILRNPMACMLTNNNQTFFTPLPPDLHGLAP